MSVSGNVSVPSAIGSQILLSVSGTNTLAYARAFAGVLNNANNAGTLTIQDLDAPLPPPGALDGNTLEYTISNSGVSATIPGGGAYLFDTAAGATTVTGSGGGDTVLSAPQGGLGGMSYIDVGGTNSILFVNGDNVYEGTARSDGSDTVISGAGHDTVVTGSNSVTVYAGTGQATITLNDTAPGGGGSAAPPIDVVMIDDGTDTVVANGASDLVVSSASGQVIDGGTSAVDVDRIVLAQGLAGKAADDTIVANAAAMGIFDYAGGNTIVGGTGTLFLVAGAAQLGTSLTDTVIGGSGASIIYGAAGSAITYSSPASGQVSAFVAGDGAESFDAAGAQGETVVFGSATGNDAVTLGGGVSLFVGAAGTGTLDTINAGTGTAYIVGAAGDDITLVAPVQSAGNVFVAGGGAETLDARGDAGVLVVYGTSTGTLTVQAGSGALTYFAAAAANGASATIAAGTGLATVFGAAGNAITLGGPSGTVAFQAGDGNETLNAASYAGYLGAYGENPADSVAGQGINLSVVGGSGINAFYTGAGQESFVAGAGGNSFDLVKTVDGLGGTITIYDYSAARGDFVSFTGYTQTEERYAIRSETMTTNGQVGTMITLSDNTKVLFVDVAVNDIVFKV